MLEAENNEDIEKNILKELAEEGFGDKNTESVNGEEQEEPNEEVEIIENEYKPGLGKTNNNDVPALNDAIPIENEDFEDEEEINDIIGEDEKDIDEDYRAGEKKKDEVDEILDIF